MRRFWKFNPLAIFPALVFVLSPFCSVVNADGEEVNNRHSTDGGHLETTSATQRKGEITPSDVFAHVAFLMDELELIRSAMGKSTNTLPDIDASGVAPREVYFQAQTLFRKAEDLCFEIVRVRGTLPRMPIGEIRPEHVWAVVDAALDCIQLAKAKLAITNQTDRHTPIADHSPTDVFRSIVQANRQLDLVLTREHSLGELFRQVTVSVSYMSRLLSLFPDAERIPAAPPFEPDANLQDVHDLLLKCFAQLREIASHLGLEVMSLTSSSSANVEHTSSEMYDVATIIVSEVAYLHGLAKGIRPPQHVYNLGDKLTAQVYERVGILALQLEQLQRLTREKPNWLHVNENRLVDKNAVGMGDRHE